MFEHDISKNLKQILKRSDVFLLGLCIDNISLCNTGFFVLLSFDLKYLCRLPHLAHESDVLTNLVFVH